MGTAGSKVLHSDRKDKLVSTLRTAMWLRSDDKRLVRTSTFFLLSRNSF